MARRTSSVINQGIIQADVAGGIITINAQPFVNQGTVTNTLGLVSITGTVDITGQTILLDTNTWLFNYLSYGGTVRGGQIITTNGASLVISGQLALDGVSFTGTIDVGNTYNGATLVLTNGLTLNGNLLIGNPANYYYGTVDIAGSQALTGNATVTFGYASSCNNSLQVLYPGTTFTLGSGISVHGQNGEIGYSACYGGFTNTVVVNQGSIMADVSGGSIYLGAPGGFTNTGSILVKSNCSVYLGGTFNAASLGTLTCSNGGTVGIAGFFENTNAIFNPNQLWRFLGAGGWNHSRRHHSGKQQCALRRSKRNAGRGDGQRTAGCRQLILLRNTYRDQRSYAEWHSLGRQSDRRLSLFQLLWRDCFCGHTNIERERDSGFWQ